LLLEKSPCAIFATYMPQYTVFIILLEEKSFDDNPPSVFPHYISGMGCLTVQNTMHHLFLAHHILNSCLYTVKVSQDPKKNKKILAGDKNIFIREKQYGQ